MCWVIMKQEKVNLREMELQGESFFNRHLRSLQLVYQIVEEQRLQLETIMKTPGNHEKDMLEVIRRIVNEIYSGCEIINELLIAIFRNDDRYRGNALKNGFNKNFKVVYDAKVNASIAPPIFQDNFIWDFFLNAEQWYVVLHDIRTQETHYEVGKIINDGTILKYVNKNRNGTSKSIYTNPDEDINVTLIDFLNLINNFLETENRIAELICQRILAPIMSSAGRKLRF